MTNREGAHEGHESACLRVIQSFSPLFSILAHRQTDVHSTLQFGLIKQNSSHVAYEDLLSLVALISRQMSCALHWCSKTAANQKGPASNLASAILITSPGGLG